MTDNKAKAIRTGFSAVDGVLYTDAGKAGLTALITRPGIGKTTFLLDIALNVAEQNKNVCLYSDGSAAKIQVIAEKKGISENARAHLHIFDSFPAKVPAETSILLIDSRKLPDDHEGFLVRLKKTCAEHCIPVLFAFLLSNAKEDLSLSAIRAKTDAVLVLSRSPYRPDSKTEMMPCTTLTYTKSIEHGETTGTDTLYFDSEKYAFITAEEKTADTCF